MVYALLVCAFFFEKQNQLTKLVFLDGNRNTETSNIMCIPFLTAPFTGNAIDELIVSLVCGTAHTGQRNGNRADNSGRLLLAHATTFKRRDRGRAKLCTFRVLGGFGVRTSTHRCASLGLSCGSAVVEASFLAPITTALNSCWCFDFVSHDSMVFYALNGYLFFRNIIIFIVHISCVILMIISIPIDHAFGMPLLIGHS